MVRICVRALASLGVALTAVVAPHCNKAAASGGLTMDEMV